MNRNQDFDLRGVLGLLGRQRGVLILALFVAFAVATLLVVTLKPSYTATALVLVDPSHKDLLSPDQASGLSSDSDRIDSEVELAKSESTLLGVVKDADLVEDFEFGPQLSLRDKLLLALHLGQPQLPTGAAALRGVVDRLADAVTVRRRGTTFLIEVSARSNRPDFAAKLANAVAAAYIRDQREAKIASVLSSRDIIQSRISDANAAVVQSEEGIDAFITANLDQIGSSTGRADLIGIRKQLDDLAASQQALLARADSATSSLGKADYKALAASLQSDAVAALEAQREQILQSIGGLSNDTQKVTDLKAELAKIQSNLDATASASLSTLRQQIAADQSKSSDLKSQLRTSVINSDLPPALLTNLYELQQNAQIARTQYQTLIARQKDLEAQAFLQVADSRVASDALEPNKPSFPNPPIIFALAGIGGLALGIAIAVLRENFIGGFTSQEQTRSVLNTPVAGVLPWQKRIKGPAAQNATLASLLANAPLSGFSEAVRHILAGVNLSLRRKQRRSPTDGAGAVVMVASAHANEGKTTVALSLARASAMSGKSTLIIDCDLRKPSLHVHLGLKPSAGLLEFLSEGALSRDVRDIINNDPASEARVILGSHHSDTPTDDLITSEAFSRLLASVKTQFDVVILDTPPIGQVVDGIYLAEFADVVVFVVKWASTPQGGARSAVASLRESAQDDIEILTVINQQKTSRLMQAPGYAEYYYER